MRSVSRILRSGFTMLEMLVAVALTIVMILFLSSIMTGVSEGVAVGLATSRVLQASRVFADQMNRDVENMVGPEGGGFLIIDTAQVGTMLSPIRIHADDAGSYPIDVDQIAFVRTRGELEPTCPDNVNSVSNSSTAPFVRVWYGHCLRTDANGGGGTSLGAAPNTYMSQWIMGRQALFLDPSPTGNHAQSARAAADVVGVDPKFWTDAPHIASYGGVQKLYGGVSDVADQTLEEIATAVATAGSPATELALYSYGANRLRVNPNRSSKFEPWHIAQAHPYLLKGVGNLTVEHSQVDASGSIVLNGDNTIAWIRPAGTAAWRSGQVWPHLIRIRFRMYDRRGRLTGSDQLAGKPFEQIIRVRR